MNNRGRRHCTNTRRRRCFDRCSSSSTVSAAAACKSNGDSLPAAAPVPTLHHHESSPVCWWRRTVLLLLVMTSFPMSSMIVPVSAQAQGTDGATPTATESYQYPPPTVALFVSRRLGYLSQNAAFGGQVNEYLNVNAMFPPEDQVDLCDFPASLQSMLDEKYGKSSGSGSTNNKNSSNGGGAVAADHFMNAISAPIAFVVGLADLTQKPHCTPERQARVALKIQQLVTDKVQYLILFGNDPNDGNALQILYPDNYYHNPNVDTSNQQTTTDSSQNKQTATRTTNKSNNNSSNNSTTVSSNGGDDDDDLYLSGEDVDLSSIFILNVNFRTGVDLQRQISFRSEWWNSNPYYLDQNNVGWSFFFRVGPYEPPRSTGHGGDSKTDSFYWFRISLFTLLIVSPCCRACYLWYAAGGRFQWRRNEETGRINGIIYIPPNRHWLAAGLIPGRLEPVSSTLSEEKFNELPEIVYVPPPAPSVGGGGAGSGNPGDDHIYHQDVVDERDSSRPATNADGNKEAGLESDDAELGNPETSPATQQEQKDTIVDEETEHQSQSAFDVENGGNVDSSSSKIATSTSTTQNSTSGSDLSLASGNATETEQKEPTGTSSTRFSVSPTGGLVLTSASSATPSNGSSKPPAAGSSFTTTCTMCSICIDDFEEGERLTLLPRCNHAFHRDCIHPWLTERQGCCPLCKTDVVEADENDDENNNGNNNNNNSSSSNNNVSSISNDNNNDNYHEGNARTSSTHRGNNTNLEQPVVTAGRFSLPPNNNGYRNSDTEIESIMIGGFSASAAPPPPAAAQSNASLSSPSWTENVSSSLRRMFRSASPTTSTNHAASISNTNNTPNNRTSQ